VSVQITADGSCELNLVAPPGTELGGYTCAFWLRLPTIGVSDLPLPIFSMVDSDDDQLQLVYDYSGLALAVPAEPLAYVAEPPPAETWIFVAITILHSSHSMAVRWALPCDPFDAARTIATSSESWVNWFNIDVILLGRNNAPERSPGVAFAMARQWEDELTEGPLLAEKLSATIVTDAYAWSSNPLAGTADTSDETGNENFPYLYMLDVAPDEPVLCGGATDAWNCECQDERIDRTLGELRTDLMIRLGFAAQALNPPPGMAALLNSFLQSAQRILYRKYEVLRTERYFRWICIPGTRFYGIRADDGDDVCDLRLDPYKVRWVGIEDLNGQWAELICGIPPERYTNLVNNWRSRPSRYEIRQCIEIYPPPDRAYALRVRGHFGLQPFTLDTHQTTIDSETVFLHALGTAKRHYRHPDAPDYFNQLTDYIGSLVSGAHHTRRYVPRAGVLPELPRPTMDQFYDGDGNPE
jgi:hypothetical protein